MNIKYVYVLRRLLLLLLRLSCHPLAVNSVVSFLAD